VNPLGVPETEADWQFVTETITRRSPVPPVGDDFERIHVAFLNGLAKDMQLMEATGRWLFSRPPNRQPAEYVPGDVLALRAKAVMDYVISFPDSKRPSIRFDAVALGALLATAQPYWLSASGVGAVLTSEPPPDLHELRLPYPAASIWFALPIQPSTAMRPVAYNSIGWLWGGPADPDFARDEAYLAARTAVLGRAGAPAPGDADGGVDGGGAPRSARCGPVRARRHAGRDCPPGVRLASDRV